MLSAAGQEHLEAIKTVQVSSLVGGIIVFHKHISVEVFEVSFILPVSETVSMISHTFEESRPIQARGDPE